MQIDYSTLFFPSSIRFKSLLVSGKFIVLLLSLLWFIGFESEDFRTGGDPPLEFSYSSSSKKTFGVLLLISGLDARHINSSFSIDNLDTFRVSFSNLSMYVSRSADKRL